MGKTKITLTTVISFITGFFGLFGLLGFCCTLAGAAFLSFLGLASISSFLIYNNKWLLIVSIIFLFLAILSYRNYKRTKVCEIKK